MASVYRRGQGWRAVVRRRGFPTRSATFPNKARAEAWARRIETAVDERRATGRVRGTVSELALRYADEVSPQHKGQRWERVRLARLATESFGQARLDGDLAAELQAWRDERLARVSGSTVYREMNLISSLFNHARREWRMNLQNPVRDVRRPLKSRPRTQRITPEVEADLLARLGYKPDVPPMTAKARVPHVLVFALETAMRLGEILKLRWVDVEPKWVRVLDTKNREDRVVPLSERARRVIDVQPKGGELVFPVNPGTFDVYWRRIRPDGLHFHDARREATSRLARRVPVETLAKITGHKDLRTLLTTYYAPSPEDLVRAIQPSSRSRTRF